MHDETNFSGSAQDWLRFAQSDLEIARIDRPPAENNKTYNEN